MAESYPSTRRLIVAVAVSLIIFVSPVRALDYPGVHPGKTSHSLNDRQAALANEAIRGEGSLDAGRVTGLTVVNVQTGQALRLQNAHLPRIVLADGRTIDLAKLQPSVPVEFKGSAFVATFTDAPSCLTIHWSVAARCGSNAIIQFLELSATRDVAIKELVFVDTPIDTARQVGTVDGSVVVRGEIFLAVEHPLANNTVGADSQVRCALPRSPLRDVWFGAETHVEGRPRGSPICALPSCSTAGRSQRRWLRRQSTSPWQNTLWITSMKARIPVPSISRICLRWR